MLTVALGASGAFTDCCAFTESGRTTIAEANSTVAIERIFKVVVLLSIQTLVHSKHTRYVLRSTEKTRIITDTATTNSLDDSSSMGSCCDGQLLQYERGQEDETGQN